MAYVYHLSVGQRRNARVRSHEARSGPAQLPCDGRKRDGRCAIFAAGRNGPCKAVQASGPVFDVANSLTGLAGADLVARFSFIDDH